MQSVQKNDAVSFEKNVMARLRNGLQRLVGDCLLLCSEGSRSGERASCVVKYIRAEGFRMRKNVSVTYIAQRNLKGLHLNSFDVEITLAIIGDAKFFKCTAVPALSRTASVRAVSS